MPAGELVTVPLPVPAFATVRVVAPAVLKVAVTVVVDEGATGQAAGPLQPPPLQPANVDPAEAAAVSVTATPLPQLAEHVVPQLMPPGELVTDPLPVPALITPSVGPAITFT